MSGFIALARENMIEVAIDGALYDSAGRLILVKEKAVPMPEVPAVIFGRGSNTIIGMITHMTAIISAAAQLPEKTFAFDGLCTWVQHHIAPAIRENAEAIGGIPDAAHGEIGLAGFSPTMGPMLAVMRTFPVTIDHGAGEVEELAPWVLYRIPEPIWIGGPDVRPELTAVGLTFDRLRRDGLRPHAVSIMTAMRYKADINPLTPDEPPRFGIGGHVQLVTVTPEGADSEILHSWDDPLGEIINPFKSAA